MTIRSRQPDTERATIAVLLYHSVADAPPPGQEHLYTVRPARFREHVRAIADSGAVPMTISELADALRGERPLPEPAVAVTFDDGFDDTVSAVEVLRDAGLSSTVYVTTGTIGTTAGISPAGLAALVDAGAELGPHTVSHPHLDEIRRPAAVAEITGSRDQLAQRLGGAGTDTFAYPHGAHDAYVRQAVIDAGFSSAAAVKNALSHPRDDPFAIARWTVTHETPPEALAALIEGRGAPLAWPGERYRTRAHRVARTLRHRIRSRNATSPPAH